MQKLKKIIYFILGLLTIPYLIGLPLSVILQIDMDAIVDYFGGVYLIVYVLFPLIYRQRIREYFPNKYLFFILLYLPFLILFLIHYSVR